MDDPVLKLPHHTPHRAPFRPQSGPRISPPFLCPAQHLHLADCGTQTRGKGETGDLSFLLSRCPTHCKVNPHCSHLWVQREGEGLHLSLPFPAPFTPYSLRSRIDVLHSPPPPLLPSPSGLHPSPHTHCVAGWTHCSPHSPPFSCRAQQPLRGSLPPHARGGSRACLPGAPRASGAETPHCTGTHSRD